LVEREREHSERGTQGGKKTVRGSRIGPTWSHWRGGLKSKGKRERAVYGVARKRRPKKKVWGTAKTRGEKKKKRDGGGQAVLAGERTLRPRCGGNM